PRTVSAVSSDNSSRHSRTNASSSPSLSASSARCVSSSSSIAAAWPRSLKNDAGSGSTRRRARWIRAGRCAEGTVDGWDERVLEGISGHPRDAELLEALAQLGLNAAAQEDHRNAQHQRFA